MNNRFGIGVGGETMAALQQLLSQLGIIVDFTVEQNPNGAVLVGNWLMSPGNVNYAEAAVPQSDSGGDINPGVVRPAMTQGVVHAADDFTPDHRLAFEFRDSANSAHFPIFQCLRKKTSRTCKWGAIQGE